MEVMKASPVVKALNWHQYSLNTQEPLIRERNEKGTSMAPTRMSAAAKLASSRLVRVRMPRCRAIIATTSPFPTMDARLIWSTITGSNLKLEKTLQVKIKQIFSNHNKKLKKYKQDNYFANANLFICQILNFM
jgi:hypothetical protein